MVRRNTTEKTRRRTHTTNLNLIFIIQLLSTLHIRLRTLTQYHLHDSEYSLILNLRFAIRTQVHALYTDVVTSAKSESRDGLVTWSSLLNSKRWQSLPHTPHITGDINRKMTYRELLRSMFPRASAIQIQAMQKFSPSCY